MRGREPGGVVDAGPESRALRDELRERFLAVRDPRDGTPVFAAVMPGEEVYAEDAAGRRPDLVLVPAPGLTVSRGLNLKRWFDPYAVLSGTHRPSGIIIAAGDGIRSGPLPRSARIVDLAPTILAAAGLPVPDDMDGRVLTELFTTPPAVRTAPALAIRPAEDTALTPDEEDLVGDRLRSLGYLE